MRLIVEQADVVVQNLAPGAAARLGISFEALAKLKPSIIVCDISGYGDDGPYRDKKAYDLLIQSEAGMVSITGTEEVPSKTGTSIADIAAGMYAYTNVLAALMHRMQTGQGQRIDISMLEALTEWMAYPLYYSFDGAAPPKRTGASHATIFPYGPFTAGDGKIVMLGLQNEREWKAFCEHVLLDVRLATDERFASNQLRTEKRSELLAIINQNFSMLNAAQVVERLERAQIANAQVNTMHEVWEHPQLKARDRWQSINTSAGEIPALLPPGSWERGAPRMDAVPALGEHTEAIISKLGYSADVIAAMRARGAI